VRFFSEAGSYCKALDAERCQGVFGARSQKGLTKERHQIVGTQTHPKSGLGRPELLARESLQSEILEQFLDAVLTIGPPEVKRAHLHRRQPQTRDVNGIGVGRNLQQHLTLGTILTTITRHNDTRGCDQPWA